MLKLNWLVCVLASAWCVSAQPSLQTEDKPLVSRLINVLQTSYTGKQPPEFYAARDQDDVDSKIVRLTDANYEELVVQGDKDTVWVVTVHEEKIVPSNQAFFDAHKNASLIFHNLTSGPSLEGTRGRDDQGRTVRFARVDYNAEWKVCTRWLIFKPPRLVFITDNGKTLRFLDTSEIAPVGEGWAKWVKEGEWSVVQVWDGSFAPNGDMQWMIEKYIKLMDSTAKIRGLPPVVWMLVSGVIGRYLLEWLWGVKPTQTQTQAQARVGSTGKKSGDAGKRAASKKTQ